MFQEEVWLRILDFSDYDVSNLGRVRSWRKPTWNSPPRTYPIVLKQNTSAKYPSVVLCRGGEKFRKYLHILVLEAFVGPCPTGMECLHGPGGRWDSSLENLEWGLHSQNVGTDRGRDGMSNCLTKLQVEQVLQMLKGGARPAKVARILGICDDTIYNIRSGKSYTNVDRS